MKKWLYKKKLKQKISSQTIAKVPSENLGRTIALIYSQSDDEKVIRKLKKDLEKQRRRSFDLVFINEKIEINPEEHPDTFSLKNINWFGWPTAAAIEIYQKQTYDLLIVLTTADIPVFHHLIQTTSAYLKIGPSAYAKHLNLIIDANENMGTKELVKQINNTLLALQPN